MDEEQYLDLLRKILKEGEEKEDRTGTGTYSLFGVKMEFSLLKNIPILTTKKVFWRKVLIELLWFISGETTIDFLQKNNVNFWNANTSREFLDKKGLLSFRENELGAGYGFLWRHFGEKYQGPDKKYKGFDQLQNIIHLLKTDPFSRRILMVAWDASQLDRVALPPCHYSVQFNCIEKDGIKYLDCMLTQRSGDCFLGIPFNIASYSFLTYMIAFLVDMKPRKFIHIIGDAHIYKTHIDAVKKQLENKPYPFPKLKIKRDVKNIDDYKISDFEIEEYQSHPYIPAPMAI